MNPNPARVAAWGVVYALAWVLHWPVLFIGLVGALILAGAGFLGACITRVVRGVHVWTFGQ